MASFLPAQIDLVLQVSIFVFLIVAMITLKLKLKVRLQFHGEIMLAAVILNLISFILVMGPMFEAIGEGASGSLGLIIYSHATFGALAFILSFIVLGTWLIPLLFENKKFRCATPLNKRFMWLVLILWVVALLLGFIMFAILSGSGFPIFGEGFG